MSNPLAEGFEKGKGDFRHEHRHQCARGAFEAVFLVLWGDCQAQVSQLHVGIAISKQ
jgi:hypothetical protein